MNLSQLTSHVQGMAKHYAAFKEAEEVLTEIRKLTGKMGALRKERSELDTEIEGQKKELLTFRERNLAEKAKFEETHKSILSAEMAARIKKNNDLKVMRELMEKETLTFTTAHAARVEKARDELSTVQKDISLAQAEVSRLDKIRNSLQSALQEAAA